MRMASRRPASQARLSKIVVRMPGTVEMTRLEDRINYQYKETPATDECTSRDAEGFAAVHAFLRFQIEDHRSNVS
jgi:hypothetical protein